MREIKFRAWNIETKKATDWTTIRKWRNFEKQISLKHVVLMQYTGLKDKNGVEIYEGDVVEYDNEKGMIVWSERCANFCVLKPNSNNLTDWGLWFREVKHFEVIGNIYENPELLKENS